MLAPRQGSQNDPSANRRPVLPWMHGPAWRPFASGQDGPTPHVRGTMDERHHPYPQQPQHLDPRGVLAPAPAHAQASAPWPGYRQPSVGVPVAGHAPVPSPAAQPGQYQYVASEGFVQPGAPGGHAQPMSAHAGMIGMPMQPSHPDAMPMLHGSARHAVVQQPTSAAMPAAGAPHAQVQAWAFPTPQGLQLVQPGWNEPASSPAGAAPQPGVRRLKWETIVPGAAVTCLIAAVALFVSDFDRITGRDSAAPITASSTKQATASETAPVDARADEGVTAATLQEATALFEAGRFDQASNMLHPLLDAETPSSEAAALHDRIEVAAQRNDALLAQLQRQRRAGKWTAVIATVGQIEALRPLSPTLVKVRQQARAAIKARAARERARAVAAKRRAAAPSRSRAGAPPAGGRRGGATTVRPPASTPAAPSSIPPRPDAPNPIRNTGSGASAVGGGAAPAGSGQNCHSHDGVMECH